MITERFQNPGQFAVPLRPDSTPYDTILEKVKEFGHIVVLPQHVMHPNEVADGNLLAAARYTGVVLAPEVGSDELDIRGQGLAWHLGSSDGIGPVKETALAFSAAVPSTVLATTGMLPAAIPAGVITDTSVAAYTATHQWETPIEMIRTYCQTRQMHWRINPNFRFDACLRTRDDVYTVTTPTVVAVRHGWGSDPLRTGTAVNRALTTRDANDFITRAIGLTVATDGSKTLAAAADVDLPVYAAGVGTNLIRTIRHSAPATTGSPPILNFLQQEIVQRPVKDLMEIDTEQWELAGGTLRVGDWIYVYDPPSGFIDPANEVHFRGSVIWPKKARVVEGTWPLVEGMGVYYRRLKFEGCAYVLEPWIDLTRYVDWEYRGQRTFSRLEVSANEGAFLPAA